MFNFFRPRPSDDDLSEILLEAIPEHLSRFLPGEPTVWHEMVPQGPRIDVYSWAPTPERPLWTLVTSGMSSHRMNVPRGRKDVDRAELMITLPADWTPLDQAPTLPEEEAQRITWPYDQLKFTARVPYLADTWLAPGTTLQA
ncbi:Suppressor of fused protein (SUFU) [Corynebacterium atrinae]|nr:Suppressor of fused protein (SUFU) [Corynebacterium atrinae]